MFTKFHKFDFIILLMIASLFIIFVNKGYFNVGTIRRTIQTERIFNVFSNSNSTVSLENKFCLEYQQTGTVFIKGTEMILKDGFKTCYLTSLSSVVEKEFSEKFLNLLENVTSWVKSPSTLRHNNIYYVTFRIRLKPTNGINISPKAAEGNSCWEYKCLTNYIYLMKYDQNFTPVGTGKIVAIPTPQGKAGGTNGAHDPRLFQLNDKLFALLTLSYDRNWISVIWDFQKHRPYMPAFQRQSLLKGKEVYEKNWVPLVKHGTLYILRNLDPMHVLKCSNLDSCMFVRNDTDALNFDLEDDESPLRGGTAFEEYQYPYYIGIEHSTIFENKKRYYRAHIVLLCVEPDFRIVYISDALKLHPHIYSKFSGPKFWAVVEGNFIFPVGLLVENKDSIVLGAHVNDQGSALFRLQGLKNMLNKVITIDQANNSAYTSEAFRTQKYLLKRIDSLQVL